MEILRNGKFTDIIDAGGLSKGLRNAPAIKKNDAYFKELSSMVGKRGILQSYEFPEKLDTSVITDSFPYPQLFVFTNYVVVCDEEHIYELVNGTLVLKITVDGHRTWKGVEFDNFLYLTNENVSVIRYLSDGSYAVADFPEASAALNYNGQVILGIPCVGPTKYIKPTCESIIINPYQLDSLLNISMETVYDRTYFQQSAAICNDNRYITCASMSIYKDSYGANKTSTLIHIYNNHGNLIAINNYEANYPGGEFASGLPGSSVIKKIGGITYSFYYTYTGVGPDGYSSSIYLTVLRDDNVAYRTEVLKAYYTSSSAYETFWYDRMINHMVVTSDNKIVCISIVVNKYLGSTEKYELYVFISDDLGATFNIVRTGINLKLYDCDFIHLVKDQDDVLYVITTYDSAVSGPVIYMWISLDDGLTWTFTNQPSFNQAYRYYGELSCATDGNTVYIMQSNRYPTEDAANLFITKDRGNTWETKLFATAYNIKIHDYVTTLRHCSLYAYNGLLSLIASPNDISYRIIVCFSDDEGDTWVTKYNHFYKDLLDFPYYACIQTDYNTKSQDGPCFSYSACGVYNNLTKEIAVLSSFDGGTTWDMTEAHMGVINTYNTPVAIL